MFNPSIDLAENETIEKSFSVSTSYLLFKLLFQSFFALLLSFYLPENLFRLADLFLKNNLNIVLSVDSFYLVNSLLVLYVSVLILNSLYLKFSNNYFLTNKRLVIRKGILNIEIKTIEYEKITDMETKQNIFERLLTFSGDLFINTAGSDDVEISLFNADTPTELKAEINTLRDQVRPV